MRVWLDTNVALDFLQTCCACCFGCPLLTRAREALSNAESGQR